MLKMYNIGNYYIERISNLKYPEAIHTYGVTEEAFLKVLKMFRKDLSINDIMEILDNSSKNKNAEKYLIAKIIKNVYSDFGYNFTEENIRKIEPYFYTIKDLISFVNDLSGKEIFVGGDLDIKWNLKIEDLFNCRSYKIYQITNE
jgi:hypothetical protein